MLELLVKAAGFSSGSTQVDSYFANLQRQGRIGSPTFDEAKRDYDAIEARVHVFLDACL
jgi:hypothetical protein